MTKKAVIFVADGVQDEEFIYPYYRLQEHGLEVILISPSGGAVYGKYGIPIRDTYDTSFLYKEDRITLKPAFEADKVEVVIVPGGWQCPELLRQDKLILNYLRYADVSNIKIGAICHGPQVLISAGICFQRNMTCYKGMKDDLINAEGMYHESNVVRDRNIVTSPHYRNNPEFMRELLDVV